MIYKSRKDIPEQYKWDIEKMYKNSAACEKDMKACVKMAEDFTKYQGHLKDSSVVVAAAIEDNNRLWQKAEKIYVYSHMKKDEDGRVSEFQALDGKAAMMIAEIMQKTAFFSPEMAAIPEKTLKAFLRENKELELYAHYFDQIIRGKAHVLSHKEEILLAQLSELNGVTDDTFNMLNDADFSFGMVTDEKGKKVPLTHASYITLMRSKKRSVRKEAYEKMYGVYRQYRNTLATLYNYNVKEDVVYSRIRKHTSSRAAALYGGNIPESVYDNLIGVVNEHLAALHRYMKLRKKVMGLKDLAMYDIYVPMIPEAERKIKYEEGQQIAIEALSVLGDDYIKNLKKGFASRWADVYENEGKHSGAYSFGSYDSMPYVLLNYEEKLEDVFTLVHEFGHSMHSLYTRKNQPFLYGDYSIFAAETASTVNENLLMQYLIKNAKSKKEKAKLLNMYLEEFRTTLFRQTQFAEFEYETHKRAEAGEVLTADALEKIYSDINKKYYGPAIKYDDLIPLEWSRIPHFYRAFYVYQYATGYSAATAISTKILKEGKKAADDYISFLKGGSSDYPIELLKIAGVDMSKPEPVEAAMQRFEEVLDELETLV